MLRQLLTGLSTIRWWLRRFRPNHLSLFTAVATLTMAQLGCMKPAMRPANAVWFVPPLSLTVSTATPSVPFSPHLFDGFDLNAFMQLRATITNNSRAAVTVSAYAPIVITALEIRYSSDGTAPGAPLDQQEGVVLFDDEPVAITYQSLVTLSPQQSMTLPIDVFGQLNVLPGTRPTIRTYIPVGPGTYFLQFVYTYEGPTAGFPNVYRGQVASNIVRVTVT